MKLWTIQNFEVLKEFKEYGILKANSRYIDEYFIRAYEWMNGQMLTKLANPPDDFIYPVWAWYQRNGAKKNKPDMRHSGYMQKGTRALRIEFEAPDSNVLLSDFIGFHYVLNYWFYALNEQDQTAFYNELEKNGVTLSDVQDFKKDSIYLQQVRSKIEESWGKIFDIYSNNEYVAGPYAEKSIQATLWEVKWEWVKKIDDFICR